LDGCDEHVSTKDDDDWVNKLSLDKNQQNPGILGRFDRKSADIKLRVAAVVLMAVISVGLVTQLRWRC